MALCPTVSPPATTKPPQELNLVYESSPIFGDFTTVVAGTRNFGSGVLRVNYIPKNANVVKVYLIVNTYVSNDQSDPTITFSGNSIPLGTPWSLCGSTCWLNPGSEPTTYLSNRVYVKDVTSIVQSNGSYQISGLPWNPAMPIGADGDRLPGCTSSQGAALWILYEYEDQAAAPRNRQQLRVSALYAGAVLIDPTTGFWGGQQQVQFMFSTYYSIENAYYSSNGKCHWVAGDIHPSIGGTNVSLNSIVFVPPNQAWPKCGNSIALKTAISAQLYASDNNSTVLQTNGNCICWSMFAYGGDKTTQPDQYSVVKCVATQLAADVDVVPQGTIEDIQVTSNFVTEDILGACGGVLCRDFPPPPFYAKIADPGQEPEDQELIYVMTTSLADESCEASCPDSQPSSPCVQVWGVERGALGSQVYPARVGTCVVMIIPNRGKNAMFRNYAGRGLPGMRPAAGRWQGRYRGC